MSAPSGELNKSLNGGENDPHAGDRRREEPPSWLADQNRLVGLWNEQLVQTNPDLRIKSIQEAQVEIAELLRRGWTRAALEASLIDPARDRTQWPREWRKLLPSRPPKVARTPLNPAEGSNKRAQELRERQKDSAEVAQLKEECGGTLNPLDPRFRRPKGKRAGAETPADVKGQPPPADGAGGSAG